MNQCFPPFVKIPFHIKKSASYEIVMREQEIKQLISITINIFLLESAFLEGLFSSDKSSLKSFMESTNSEAPSSFGSQEGPVYDCYAEGWEGEILDPIPFLKGTTSDLKMPSEARTIAIALRTHGDPW